MCSEPATCRWAPRPRAPGDPTMSESAPAGPTLSREQQHLNDLWEEHVRDEFVGRDTDATLATMVADAYVNHVPVMTGGAGREALRHFYSQRFIPQIPADTQIVPVSPTTATHPLPHAPPFPFPH